MIILILMHNNIQRYPLEVKLTLTKLDPKCAPNLYVFNSFSEYHVQPWSVCTKYHTEVSPLVGSFLWQQVFLFCVNFRCKRTRRMMHRYTMASAGHLGAASGPPLARSHISEKYEFFFLIIFRIISTKNEIDGLLGLPTPPPQMARGHRGHVYADNIY